MALFKRESNTISLANFWENYQLGKYDFAPGYQRDSVWSEEKQAFLIDSILKNIPIPPIFLHQIIDDDTGKTSYAVIDGKQRLTSIIDFIKGEINSSSGGEDSPLFNEELAGLEFSDLEASKFIEVRRAFWRYSIPIEYIDTSDKSTIDAIFDRLNRNGEPLEGQELRRAGYYGTELLNHVEALAKTPFWATRLEHVDVKRMEDREFISEILFFLLEDSPLKADQKELDKLYKKYKDDDTNWEDITKKFLQVTDFMCALDVKYIERKVNGVSHLYALWGLSKYCCDNAISAEDISGNLDDFYHGLRTEPESNDHFVAYKKSMASSTRDKGARVRRINALKEYLGV
jgi:uncharacterized protein with ParB-like and HNH nuclease domain